jgi:hypothetical protein
MNPHDGPPGYGPPGWGPPGYGPPGYGPPGHGMHGHPPGPMHGGPMKGYGAPGVHHEFGPEENATIGSTGTWARALGIVGFIEAGFDLLNGNVFGAGIALGIGYTFFQAGQSMRNVVATQGHDVHHLMRALQQIGSAFQVRIVVMAIAAGLLLLVGLFGVVIAILAATN